ncbi:uncharacterized protein ZBAI_01632 [Zygosaccharomyces bailii ISA1307]|nr:uncharacterized protein ZBAI_01632 [Zygosaccharomyces bailii ISA1307]
MLIELSNPGKEELQHLAKENNKLAAPRAQKMKGSKYTVEDIGKLWEYKSVQNKNEPLVLEENNHVERKHDDDLPMLDMDDESVERVSNYLSDRRISDSVARQATPFRTKEQIDLSNKYISSKRSRF